MDPRYKSPESPVLQNETDEFRDLQAHTTLLVWLLRVGAGLAVLAIASNWMQLELLGRHYTLQEAQANDLRERTITMSTLVIALACYAVFGRWIVLAHRNLPSLGLAYPDVTPGAALGWFFVPIANLWKPYQAMSQLWKASLDTSNWQQQDEPPLLIAWWSLWIIAGLYGSLMLAANHPGKTVAELIGTTRWLLIGFALRAPQYVIAWFMVRKIWEAQAAQRRRQLAGRHAVELQGLVAPA